MKSTLKSSQNRVWGGWNIVVVFFVLILKLGQNRVINRWYVQVIVIFLLVFVLLLLFFLNLWQFCMCLFQLEFSTMHLRNAGHNIAIVGEPYNVDAHANIPDQFMTILCPRLCVHMYFTHWLWLYSCLSSLTARSIASIQGTPHTHTRHTTHDTSHRVKCWARVPRLKILDMTATLGSPISLVQKW